MNFEYNIHDFLSMYYLDSNIPMYLYGENRGLSSVPKQTSLTFPPQEYLNILLAKSDRVSYCSTDYGIYFGCLKLDLKEADYLIMGPVSNIPYTNDTLLHLHKDYVIPNDDKKIFLQFWEQIPQTSLSSLLAKLMFINYCLHGEQLSLSDFIPNDFTPYENDPFLTEASYIKKEKYVQNKSYVMEDAVMRLVRTGNPKGFEQLKFNDSNYHIGVTANTPLRQLKNTIIISTTLCTRAAIEGGLDYDTAYELSDGFIQAAEQIQNSDSLNQLLAKIGSAFAEKVQQAKTPLSSDERVQKAIRYIHQNTNQNISVGDVANSVGLSKSYFSAYFKNILGFSVSSFILRCKLEESRQLLRFTDKPISTISNFLCFSSQSHFQTAFKKQFGMTPVQFRKQSS